MASQTKDSVSLGTIKTQAEIAYWKELILEMREMGCNNVADMLVSELEDLENGS